jgi:hypothetical protein
MSHADTLTWRAHALVEKWSPDQVAWAQRRSGLVAPSGAELAELVRPDDLVEWEGNLLVNAGIQRLEDLLIGAGGQAFTNSWARIGVGDGTTAAAASDTDLSAVAGSTHRWFQAMDATFPSRAGSDAVLQEHVRDGGRELRVERVGHRPGRGRLFDVEQRRGRSAPEPQELGRARHEGVGGDVGVHGDDRDRLMAATVKVRCRSCRKQAEIVAPKRSELPVLWECPHCDERNTLTDVKDHG